jgi:glycosyltransferase involved in cell wall biosynthesis
MNLLYVTKTSLVGEGGGGEERAREVVGGLADRGHDVTVLCGKTEAGLEKRTAHRGCQIRHVWCGPERALGDDRFGFLLPRYLFAFTSIPVLVMFFARSDYEVVVENMTPYPTLTVLLARLFAVPIVAVLHEFHGRDCIEMYGPLTGRILLIVQRLHRALRYDAVVVPSSPVKAALEEYEIASDRIEVVPNGIHYERYDHPDVESDSGRIVTVGRLCKRKGQADLLRGFAKIQKSHPETHLDIVGSGPQRAALEELSAELDVRENVEFHGFVSEEEKIRLLNHGELFVFGSHQEGFGIGILEAMAAGLPVVARYLPVYEEFFENEVHGFLVDEPFVEEFCTATEDLLEADGERTDIGARNREAAADYGWEHAVSDMESIILEIAECPKTSEQGVTAEPYD